jgi:hypothetical protein
MESDLPPDQCRTSDFQRVSFRLCSGAFAVPANLKFLAVLFFDLYGNAQRSGPAIASLPEELRRYRTPSAAGFTAILPKSNYHFSITH